MAVGGRSVWLDRQARRGRRWWVERGGSRWNNRRWWPWRRKRWCGGLGRRTRRWWRHRWLRAESGLVPRLRARYRRLLRRRLSRHRLPASGWRSGRRIRYGRRCGKRRRRRARRDHWVGWRWRRGWVQWPRRHRWWIRRHGWIHIVRCARMHEQRTLRAPKLWRHGSTVQSGPRWRPVSDRMDLSGFLQHFTNTGARLRGAAMHPA